MVIPEHRAVGVTPSVSNASAGAVEHLRVARVTNLSRALESMKARNIWTYGLAMDAAAVYYETDLHRRRGAGGRIRRQRPEPTRPRVV